MHLIKNLGEHVVHLISGLNDSHKGRAEEKARNRFRSTWVDADRTSQSLPPAPFRMTKEERQIANERALNFQVPHTFDWRPRALFLTKAVGMKSHEWKEVVCAGILKFCIRGLLGSKQRATLFEFCDVLAMVCSEELCATELADLEKRVHRVLCLLERDFPVSLHVIVFHLLHHLPAYLQRFGPVYGYWMYPMERFNSWITRRVMNRRFPEATVIETYRLSELANFMDMSGQLPTGSLTIPSDTDEESLAEEQGSPPLQGQGTVLSVSQLQHLDEYYQQYVPEYRTIVMRYREDRRRARINRQLKSFPSIKEWSPVNGLPLTAQEKDMCKGP